MTAAMRACPRSSVSAVNRQQAPHRRPHPPLSLRNALAQPHRGALELVGLAGLYGVYELIRGFGSTSLEAARRHAADVVALELHVHVSGERALQSWVQHVPALPGLLGLAYVTLHLAATAATLTWIHRAHRERFPLVRTTLVIATGIALAIYVVYPAAPPRLAGLGFADTVSAKSHVNLSSDLLGSLYNPFAAVPSLHFGYALLVGAAVFSLARSRRAKVFGAAYPVFMLFDIVATGNHFLFDAAAGGAVVIVAWFVARRIVAPAAQHAGAERPPRALAGAMS